MVNRAVLRTRGAATLRGGLSVLLACISLPAVAASGFNLKCDDAPVKPSDLTASNAVPAEPAGDHEPLKVVKAEGDVRNLAGASDLGSMLEPDFDGESGLTALEQQELRSSALADALERRREGRLKVSPAGSADSRAVAPPIDTALPGLGDTESLIYRREMYRTDI